MTTTNNKIMRALATAPAGLLSHEVAAETNLPSYVVATRLSKLAAYGVIDKRPGTTKQNYRWTAKPETATATA